MVSLGVAACITLGAWAGSHWLRQQAGVTLKQEQQRILLEQKYLLQSGLEDLAANAVSLAYMAAGRLDTVPTDLARDFQAYAKTRQVYEQIRLIDGEGRELVKIKKVSPAKGSAYFRSTVPSASRPPIREAWLGELEAAPRGTPVFFSVLAGAEEATSVLRIGVAVPSQTSAFVVLDYAFENLFARLDHEVTHLQTLILDAQGNWLRRAKASPAAPGGFAQTQGTPSLAKALPELWKELTSSQLGVLHRAEGLMTFDTIQTPSEGDPALPKFPPWKILSWTAPGEILKRQADTARPAWWMGLVALGFFSPLTYFAVSARERERSATSKTETAHALLQNVTNSAPDGIVAASAVRGPGREITAFRIELCNAQAEGILTLLRREGDPPENLPADLFSPCLEVFSGAVSTFVERQLRETDGTPHWVRVKIVKRQDGVVLTLSDVTQQKRNLHELVEAKEAAEIASRSQSQFLAMMGHEIRTPMNGLLGFATLLSGTELTPEQRDYLATLRASGEALLRILEDIMDYSRMEYEAINLKSVPLDPRELVSQVHQLFFLAVDSRKLILLCQVSPDIPGRILGDDVRLRQILVNLVGNAVKFSEHGTIQIRAERQRGPEGDLLVFHVKDDGPGLDPEIVDRLFQPFTQVDSTTSRKFGGTGLGLSICKRLAELMGGAIDVQTAPGQGSDFFFTLPIREPDAAVPVQNPAPDSRWDGLRILVVDDDPVNRKLIARTTEKTGAMIQLAESGYEALTAVQTDRFDLILMDVQMPGMDGLETTRRIRQFEEAQGIPRGAICALTANVAPEDKRRCLESGMDDFLAKPLRLERFRELLVKVRERAAGR